RKRSSAGEAGEHVHQWFAAIGLGQFVRVDELVTKPGKFVEREGLNGPVDHPRHARYALGVGMISEPYVHHLVYAQIERHKLGADCQCVSRQYSDPRAFSDSPIMRAADIRAHRDQTGRRYAREQTVVELAPFGIVVSLNENPVMAQISRRLWLSERL